MLKTIYCCDRCGKEITGDIYDIGFGIYNNLNEVEDWDGNKFHLCEKCVTDILSSIYEYKRSPFRKHSSTHNDKETVLIDDLPKYQEGQDIELPFGVEKEYKKTYNLNELLNSVNDFKDFNCKECDLPDFKAKKKQEIKELDKAVSNLNNKLMEFSKTAELTPSKKNTTEDSIGRSLADKLIKEISNISAKDLIMPGALENKIMNIENSLTSQELDYLHQINQNGEITNFFAQIFEDVIKRH